MPGKFGLVYPAFGGGVEFSADWMSHILLRNLLASLLICGTWDWFLYFSPLHPKLAKYKMSPAYPSPRQILHDAAMTLSASCIAGLLEICLCHLWAAGQLSLPSLAQSPLTNLVMALSLGHYRTPHFYLIHRLIHPWRTTQLPDLGKVLYRKVHYLHHKSYNPTAFSGTSMHPVEAGLYYSAALIPVLLGLHPVHSLAVIVDCGLGAWLSHDGFHWPGSGSYFHILHHRHFDCNYGSSHLPIDWLFGTYVNSKDQVVLYRIF